MGSRPPPGRLAARSGPGTVLCRPQPIVVWRAMPVVAAGWVAAARQGWHALRYSEGRGSLLTLSTPFGVPQGVPPGRKSVAFRGAKGDTAALRQVASRRRMGRRLRQGPAAMAEDVLDTRAELAEGLVILGDQEEGIVTKPAAAAQAPEGFVPGSGLRPQPGFRPGDWPGQPCKRSRRRAGHRQKGPAPPAAACCWRRHHPACRRSGRSRRRAGRRARAQPGRYPRPGPSGRESGTTPLLSYGRWPRKSHHPRSPPERRARKSRSRRSRLRSPRISTNSWRFLGLRVPTTRIAAMCASP